MLSDIRKKRGFSQMDLSRLSGMSVRTIQHYEQAPEKLEKAIIENLLKMAIVLECKISDLLPEGEVKDNLKRVEGLRKSR